MRQADQDHLSPSASSQLRDPSARSRGSTCAASNCCWATRACGARASTSMWPTPRSMPPRVPWTPWRYQQSWGTAMSRPPLEVADVVRQHGAAFLARYGPTLSGAQHRTLRAIACVPDRCPRGPYHAVRPLWPRGPGVQLVPAPLLPQMPWRGPSRVARRPGARGARDTLRRM